MEKEIRIDMTPVFIEDEKTGSYVVFYEEYPIASGTGKSKAEAEVELQLLCMDIMNSKYKRDFVSEVVHQSSKANLVLA